MFPSEKKMMQDAQLSFPRHPMYKDINKKYREGYLRGQIDLIRSMKKKMKVLRHNRYKSYAIYKSNEPAKPCSPVLKIKESRTYKDILRDKDLNDNQKINKLEAELDGTLDISTYDAIRKQIDLLEDKVSMNYHLKNNKRRKHEEIEFL